MEKKNNVIVNKIYYFTNKEERRNESDYRISASAGSKFSGFSLIQEGIFTMILVLLLSCVLIATEFVPNLQSKKKEIYLIGAIAGIILSIIASASVGSVEAQAVGGVVDLEIGRKIGFWLEILCFVVIGGYTVKKEWGMKA